MSHHNTDFILNEYIFSKYILNCMFLLRKGFTFTFLICGQYESDMTNKTLWLRRNLRSLSEETVSPVRYIFHIYRVERWSRTIENLKFVNFL